MDFFGAYMNIKRIESRNNPTIKSITALRDRKARESERLFYFEGVHLLEEYLRAGYRPKFLFLREDVTDKYISLAEKAECEIYEVTESVYSKLSEEKAPQGIFTVSELLPNLHYARNENELEQMAGELNGNSIMLVDMQDNGNVGTVIRTSAALDCKVLLCGNCADVYSPKTARATMGALFTNDIYICPDTLKAIAALRNKQIRVIASALDERAQRLGEYEINENDCFVVGNEGKGLPQTVIEKCDMTCFIPMTAKTESLNAASAASVLLWEAKRGKLK